MGLSARDRVTRVAVGIVSVLGHHADTSLGRPGQVGGRGRQGELPAGPVLAAVLQSHLLDPAKSLLDPLARGIAGMTNGPAVDHRAVVAHVLGDVRGRIEFLQGGYKARRVGTREQRLHLGLPQHRAQELGRDRDLQQPITVLGEHRHVPHRIVDAETEGDESVEQQVVVQPCLRLTRPAATVPGQAINWRSERTE